MEKNDRNNTEKKAAPVVVHRRPASKKRKKMSRGRITIMVLVIVLSVAIVVFLALMGWYMLSPFFGGETPPEVDLTPYSHTDAQYQDKMSYYVLGILGNEEDPCMQSLSLVCHDKQQGTLSVLQIPRDLYIDDQALWGEVHRAGDIFSQPRPYDWCDACKQRLYQGQIGFDGRHITCGVTATQRQGSARLSLMDFFNDQLGVPVDHYFLLPQEAFVKLVDLMGGITLDLECALDTNPPYDAGVRIVDGEAALYYMSQRQDNAVQSELDMLQRQRAVLASVLQKLFDQTEQNYRQDVLLPIQSGSTPMLSDISDKDELIAFVMSVRDIPMQKITVSLVPGAIVNHQSAQYYSADRDALVQLLNASFNPVGPRITISDVRLPELTDAAGGAPQTKTLAEYLPPESQ